MTQDSNQVRSSFLAAATALLALGIQGCAPGENLSLASSSESLHGPPAVRAFTFRYEATIAGVPESAKTVFLWLPFPPDTEDQTVHSMHVDAPFPYEIVTESRYGNRALRFDVPPGTERATVVVSVEIERRERIRRPGQARPLLTVPGNGVSGESRATIEALAPERWLESDRLIPVDETIRAWAQESVGEAETDIQKVRAIYDYAIENLKYDKRGDGWGRGDIYWACDAKRGNCTDFHALVIGYSRALGIPARFEMGFPVPPDRGEGEIDGYHCWAQLYVQGHGWLPVDASQAFKYPERREYFFGAHDENRILFTYGRDLSFPGMEGEPLNDVIYPYAEVDGRSHEDLEKRFSYRDLERSPARAEGRATPLAPSPAQRAPS